MTRETKVIAWSRFFRLKHALMSRTSSAKSNELCCLRPNFNQMYAGRYFYIHIKKISVLNFHPPFHIIHTKLEFAVPSLLIICNRKSFTDCFVCAHGHFLSIRFMPNHLIQVHHMVFITNFVPDIQKIK